MTQAELVKVCRARLAAGFETITLVLPRAPGPPSRRGRVKQTILFPRGPRGDIIGGCLEPPETIAVFRVQEILEFFRRRSRAKLARWRARQAQAKSSAQRSDCMIDKRD